MTATAAIIAEMSPFSVDDQTSFSKATFSRLSLVAKAILDQSDPGLPTELYDHAHALLICHLYISGKEDKGALKSETIGGYSYSKEAGASSYLMQYQSILASYSGGIQSTGQTRVDADMNEMHLDQSTVPTYGDE